MKRIIVWIWIVVMALIPGLCVTSVGAQDFEHAWILVDIVDYDSREAWAIANKHEEYHNEFSCSQGSFSIKKFYTGKGEEWRNPPKLQGEAVRITATFSKPPAKILPNQKIILSLKMWGSENSLSFFTFSGSAQADFDSPALALGSRKSTVLFMNQDGENFFQIGGERPYGMIQETLSATPRSGRQVGEQIALRQQFYGGISMGTYYVYEWQKADTQISQELQNALLASVPLVEVSQVGVQKGTLRLWANDSVAPNEDIVVHYQDFPGNKYDWITIVPADFPDNNFKEYYYTDGARSGLMTFAGLEPGQYEVRSYHNWSQGGYTVQDRYPFTVGEHSQRKGRYAWSEQEVYTPNTSIHVQYQNFPGNSSDWITIVPVDFPDDHHKEYYYTNGTRSGTMTFKGLEPGQYEVRSYFNWPSGGYEVVDRHSFWVKN
ncbi:MAG: hypothetical protein M0R49_12385 [Limnochordia bacterium]|nr:hypothetical protein [Limnochordia bacterium]